ncbi:MAG1360 family OppF-related protein [Mycoplasma nasistruthionis]|uniref:Uncharacterized protein n=1 Tax=Mycoplasma nasistruthionis TaxID=353852 RepID=A0A4Y6I5U2_9MOLU|nr:hypothetical protein [Mycoplasma nasistruthionis]QDF64994.1 hypothetical protein FIV53_01600 [Mycoplasma nasistruthionis]
MNELLIIENIFVPKKKKSIFNWNKSNWPQWNLSVPKLIIYNNENTAFYIPYDNKNLTFPHIEKQSMLDDNVILTYFEKSQNVNNYHNSYEFTNRKKDILHKIDYFDIQEIVEQNDLSKAWYWLWKDCLKATKQQIKKTNIEVFINHFEFLFKNSIYNLLKHSGTEIIDLNNQFVKDFLNAKKSLLEYFQQNDTSNSEISNKISDLQEIILTYKEDLIEIYFNFFKSFKDIYLSVTASDKPNMTLQLERKIRDLNVQLKYMKKINDTSITKVENDLKIRDLNWEIEYYKKHIKHLNKQAKKLINAIVLNLKKEIKTLNLKKQQLENNNEEYFDAIKDIQLKKFELKIWNKNYKKLLYLTNSEIWNLNLSIKSEINLFVNNNFLNLHGYSDFSIREIKNFIKQEFDFDIASYLNHSKKKCDFVNQQITNASNGISEIKRLKFNHLSSYTNSVSTHEFQEKIHQTNAELNWTHFAEERLFKSRLLSKEFKLKRVSTNIKDNQNEILTFSKSLLNKIAKSKVDSIFINQVSEVIFDLRDFIKNNWGSNLLAELISYTSTNEKLTTKLLKKFWAIINFANTYQDLSIPQYAYLETFNELDSADKAKLKLAKYRLAGIEILFIQDILDKKDEFENKNEFLRVLLKLTSSQNINCVFITSNLETIRQNFDRVYFFDDSQLLEAGLVSEVFENAVHPLVKTLIKNPDISLNYQRNPDFSESFVKETLHKVDSNENHVVYSTLKQLQGWLHLSKTSNKVNSLSDTEDGKSFEEKQKFINENYVSILNEQQINLTEPEQFTDLNNIILTKVEQFTVETKNSDTNLIEKLY